MNSLPGVTVNIHEAKTHLSELLGRVSAGEEIIIARAGRPIARLSRYAPAAARELGIDDGRGSIDDDFDTYIPPEFSPYV